MTGSDRKWKVISLCQNNEWFTCGSCRQYDKLFDMIEDGRSTEDIALVIWVCSDYNKLEDYNKILGILKDNGI